MMYRNLLLVGAVFFAGCVSLTSFQSPEALPPGGTLVGGGLAANWWGLPAYPLPEADLLFRYGLGKRFDVGGKVALPFASASADVKWQFLNGPFMAAFDVGASYARSPFIPDISEGADIIGAWPEVIVGTDRVYASARVLMMNSIGYQYNDWRPDTTTTWLPQVFLGGSFGDRLKVMTALSITLVPAYGQKLGVLPGIGIALGYGPGSSGEDATSGEW